MTPNDVTRKEPKLSWVRSDRYASGITQRDEREAWVKRDRISSGHSQIVERASLGRVALVLQAKRDE